MVSLDEEDLNEVVEASILITTYQNFPKSMWLEKKVAALQLPDHMS